MGNWSGSHRVLMERDHLEDPGVDGRITKNRYSRSGMGRHRPDCSVSAFECSNEPLGSRQGGEFLDYLKN
jgi:hypothetical protein